MLARNSYKLSLQQGRQLISCSVCLLTKVQGRGFSASPAHLLKRAGTVSRMFKHMDRAKQLKEATRILEKNPSILSNEALNKYLKLGSKILAQQNEVREEFPAKETQENRLSDNEKDVLSRKPSPIALSELALKVDDLERLLAVLLRNHRGPLATFMYETARLGVGIVVMVLTLAIFFESSVPKGLSIPASSKKTANVIVKSNVCFNDVRGMEEVKEEFREVVAYLHDVDKFKKLGAKLPKGILLCGPPGTGKTLLARAVAGEASVPFIQAEGSDFEEMFVGVGARRVRDLFKLAKQFSPCIIFIDEIDAVGSKRLSKETSSTRMTLNQLLVELDGFLQDEGIIVICATNLPETLDKALTRSGRLDKIIHTSFPDLKSRLDILRHYGKKLKLAEDVDLEVLAQRTTYMTGADLFNVLNSAAITSTVQGDPSVSMKRIEEAFDRIVVGLEKKNPMSDKEKKLTAIHEAGHVLVSWFTDSCDKVHKATIMPRGNALGITWHIKESDRYQRTLTELQGELDSLMGGRAAEEIIYGHAHVTTGSSSDLKKATKISRELVMSTGLNPSQKENSLMVVNNEDYAALSNEYRLKIDHGVDQLLKEAYERAFLLLKQKKDLLLHIAENLLEHETLSHAQIEAIMKEKNSDTC